MTFQNPSLSEMTAHLDDSEESLEHYGIKGMKWGVRRSQKELDAASGGNAGEGNAAAAAAKPRSSADAKTYDRLSGKAPESLSNDELQLLLRRSNLLRQYEVFFNPSEVAKMQKQVDTWNLHKNYAKLRREVNPTRKEKVQDFVSKLNGTYKNYQKLDKKTKKQLSSQVNSSMDFLLWANDPTAGVDLSGIGR